MPKFIFPFIVLSVFFCIECHALNVEQDRRVEEKKRIDLSPTFPIAGATQDKKSKISGDEDAPVPYPAEPIYLINLTQRRFAYRYDIAKSVTILMGMDDELLDLNAQVSYLQDQGWLPEQYQETFDPTKPLRRGLAAYIYLKMLDIKGGIALHLFGSSERYALSELAFAGIMSPGHVQDLISGQELVQMMDQAARYKVKQEGL